MLRRSIASLQVVALLGALGACATSRAPVTMRFAVAPPLWVTPPAPDAPDLGVRLTQPFARLGAGPITTPPVTPDCAESALCLAEVGRASGGDKLVLLRLAQLGTPTLMRVASVDVAMSAIEQTAQAVIDDSSAPELESTTAMLASRVAAPYQPVPPWYRRPGMIVAASVAVVAVTVLTIVLVGRDARTPDLTVVPP